MYCVVFIVNAGQVNVYFLSQPYLRIYIPTNLLQRYELFYISNELN